MFHRIHSCLHWPLLASIAAIVLLYSLSLGAYQLNWDKFISFSFSKLDLQVLMDIRLPRALLAGSVGCLLAVSGAALQGIFRNPLADPGLIGISSGAALAVGLTIVIIPSLSGFWGVYGLSIAAFAGGILTAALIFSLAGKANNSVIHLILAGVAINAIVGAAVGFLTYLSNDEQLRALTFWTMGSFGGALWPSVIVALTIGTPILIFIILKAKDLDRLLLGDQNATYMGTNPATLKKEIIILTSLAVGVSVAVSGIIGFIGLVVPHLIRLIWSASHQILLPASAILGAVLAIIADTLARTLVSPAEMPVGIITSLIGGPFFLWLLYHSRQTVK